MPSHIPRLYIRETLVTGQEVSLDAGQQQHVVQVMRASVGDPVIVFNGDGGEFDATVSHLKKGQARVLVGMHQPASRESRLQTTLYLCVLKRDAMNAAISRATELGITRISPTLSANVTVSRKQMSARSAAWQTIAIAAAEQCGRTVPPVISDITDVTQVLEQDTADYRLLADGTGSPWGADQTVQPESVSMLIGPEGGLTEEEVLGATGAGWQLLNLGPRILRAETAPATLLGLVQQRWGDI